MRQTYAKTLSTFILAAVLPLGCTSPGGIKEQTTNQAVAPPDAVMFISGMS